jgi:hypothetical protein
MAVSVMNDWLSWLGGHIEWAPHRIHYEHLLQAQRPDNWQPFHEHEPWMEPAAQVAWEVYTIFRDAYAPSLRPTWTSLAWVVRCMVPQQSCSNMASWGDPLSRWDAVLTAFGQQVAGTANRDNDEDLLLLLVTIYEIGCCYPENSTQSESSTSWTSIVQFWMQLMREPRHRLRLEKVFEAATRADQEQLLTMLDQTLSRYQRQIEASDVPALEASVQPFEASRLPVLRLHHYRALCQAVLPDSTPAELDRLLDRLETCHSRAAPWLDAVELRSATNALLQRQCEMGAYDRVHATFAAAASPDSLSYSLVLKALAQQSGKAAAAAAPRAHATWQRLVQEYAAWHETTNDDDKQLVAARPTAQHYGWTMMAWSRSRHPSAHVKCLEIFQHMVADDNLQPTNVHWAILFGTMGYSGQPEATLRRFNELWQEMARQGVQADLATAAAALGVCARLGTVPAAQRAEHLLASLTARSISPTLGCFHAVMLAWARAAVPESFDRCFRLYQRLERAYQESDWHEDWQPTPVIYSTLLLALKADPRPDVGETVMQLLDSLQQCVDHGRAAPPNQRVYEAALQVLVPTSRHDAQAPARAQVIYARLLQASRDDPDCKVDVSAVTSVCQVWANSLDPDKAQWAWQHWQNLMAGYRAGQEAMRPTTYTIQAVLKACRYSPKQEKVAQMALRVYLDVQAAQLPMNELVYGTLIHVLGTHLDDEREREQCIDRVFRQCCADGLVSEAVIRPVLRFAPNVYRARVVDADRLPSDWTRSLTTTPLTTRPTAGAAELT